MIPDDVVSRTLEIESAEDLQRAFPNPDTCSLDMKVHRVIREEHPEWFKDK